MRQAVPPGLRAVAAGPARGEHLRPAFARECALLAPYAGIALALVPLPVISPCKADMSLSGSRTLSTLSSGSRASSSLFSLGIHPSLCHRTQRERQTYRQSELAQPHRSTELLPVRRRRTWQRGRLGRSRQQRSKKDELLIRNRVKQSCGARRSQPRLPALRSSKQRRRPPARSCCSALGPSTGPQAQRRTPRNQRAPVSHRCVSFQTYGTLARTRLFATHIPRCRDSRSSGSRRWSVAPSASFAATSCCCSPPRPATTTVHRQTQAR